MLTEVMTGWRAASERDKLLRYVQPSLIGLIDGTISTLAPIFAAAYAANSRTASPSSSSSSRSSASAS